LLLLFVPVLPPLLALMAFARSFGKSGLFGLALAVPFVSFFAWPLLGFGDVRYQGPAR
jgi:hypothetical protein